MTTLQTICSILVVLSTFGLFFAIWLGCNRYSEASFIGLVSLLGCVTFGICLVLTLSDQHNPRGFDEKRKMVLSIISNKFEAVCDRAGLDTISVARPNCVEKQGFRAWREGGKLYVATIIGDNNVIEIIVKEDELLAGKRSAIVYWSEQLDGRRLSYAFSPYTYSAYE